MTYPGTDMKFRITTEIPDFQLSEDGFGIVVRDKYMRVTARIAKDDCFYDDEGRWYFTLPRVRSGWYYAFFTAWREDEDFDDQLARYDDSQPLCTVGYCERHAPRLRDCDEGHHLVHYEQVWSVSIDGADYLADCDGRYVLTSDGKRIQFTNATSEYVEEMGKVKMKMSGKEFLKMWEGRDPNGEIDTIPEMFDAAQGIGDDETIPQKIQQEIDDSQEENEAGDSDIDEIFEQDAQDGTGGSGGFPDEMQEEEGD